MFISTLTTDKKELNCIQRIIACNENNNIDVESLVVITSEGQEVIEFPFKQEIQRDTLVSKLRELANAIEKQPYIVKDK